MKLQPGRYFYGLAAITFGVITLAGHQINSFGKISLPEIVVYIAGLAEIIGGLVTLWEKTLKFGAIVLGIIYLIFTLKLIIPIIKMPLAYYNWGNFFEEFSIFLGSVFILASTIRNVPERKAKITRASYLCFGICVISYSLYQLFYLKYTAGLVPKWLPPNQMFWAVSTTVAFALAAIAILSGRLALLASRLLAIMFIGFVLLVWIPACISNPHSIAKWIGIAETIAVTGSAWVVADFLYHSKKTPLKTPVEVVPVADKI